MPPMPRLLILDDDPAIAQTIAAIAQRDGFDVRCVDRTEEFFALVVQWSPTHLAVDLVMPGMDGVEVLRLLAEKGCTARIVLTSGMGSKVLESVKRSAEARGLHISGILPKPFKNALLRELLKESRPQHQAAPGASIDAGTPLFGEEQAQDAFTARRLFLHYQPKVSLSTEMAVGFEALVRWRHPDGRTIGPDHFVPFLERSGRIQQLTDYVIEDALSWFVGVPPLVDRAIKMSVNLSARNLVDIHLADRLSARCASVGVLPGSVILELTETSAMANPTDALDILSRLRIKGFELAIDDFGTGYSSMVQLARLPFSELKIDKSFVSSMLHSEESRKIVGSTIELSRSLGIISVAEGIEDAATAAMLRGMGCDLGQGYFFGRPMDGPQAERWLLNRSRDAMCG